MLLSSLQWPENQDIKNFERQELEYATIVITACMHTHNYKTCPNTGTHAHVKSGLFCNIVNLMPNRSELII